MSEGGQRCATHTRKQYAYAERVLAENNRAVAEDRRLYAEGSGPRGTLLGGQVNAEQMWMRAAKEHASTPTGERELRAALDALETTGDDPRRAAMLDIAIEQGRDLRRANKEAHELMKQGRMYAMSPAPMSGEDQTGLR